MNFYPDFSVTGVVIAVSPRGNWVTIRTTEDGITYEPQYKLSYFAHRSLPQVGRKVDLSIGERDGTFINDWCYLDAPAAPYKLEPEPVGEDIPFEVSR